jgi:N-acetylglutamate synthase-like GNAT family acetyltransferase
MKQLRIWRRFNSYEEAWDYEIELFDNEQMVARCGLENEAYIHSVTTFPKFRGKGYATTMLKTLIALYSGKRLTLHVLKGNLPALKLYDKLGFSTCDEYTEDILTKEIIATETIAIHSSQYFIYNGQNKVCECVSSEACDKYLHQEYEKLVKKEYQTLENFDNIYTDEDKWDEAYYRVEGYYDDNYACTIITL